jgi:hypothetical protein
MSGRVEGREPVQAMSILRAFTCAQASLRQFPWHRPSRMQVATRNETKKLIHTSQTNYPITWARTVYKIKDECISVKSERILVTSRIPPYGLILLVPAEGFPENV